MSGDSLYEMSVNGGADYKYSFDAEKFNSALSKTTLKEVLDALTGVVSASGNNVIQIVSGNQYTLKGKTFTFSPDSLDSTNFAKGIIITYVSISGNSVPLSVNVTLSGNEISGIYSGPSMPPIISGNPLVFKVSPDKISIPENIINIVNPLLGFDSSKIILRK